ncbi:hypothetical protein BP00DRAFT_159900 [Aspergillus indologenus CBS 114.80]|uniref:Uncharacterized protein n=1 Tax=Aspergillus indologenus CBS 114.80 TaxID=1450541 RepID=A0A2V5I6L4_9EURO|nr:hypothetical protein BP00DRAFT_159900 [Aspergillus indologenus CBS 114.80]
MASILAANLLILPPISLIPYAPPTCDPGSMPPSSRLPDRSTRFGHSRSQHLGGAVKGSTVMFEKVTTSLGRMHGETADYDVQNTTRSYQRPGVSLAGSDRFRLRLASYASKSTISSRDGIQSMHIGPNRLTKSPGWSSVNSCNIEHWGSTLKNKMACHR